MGVSGVPAGRTICPEMLWFSWPPPYTRRLGRSVSATFALAFTVVSSPRFERYEDMPTVPASETVSMGRVETCAVAFNEFTQMSPNDCRLQTPDTVLEKWGLTE